LVTKSTAASFRACSFLALTDIVLRSKIRYTQLLALESESDKTSRPKEYAFLLVNAFRKSCVWWTTNYGNDLKGACNITESRRKIDMNMNIRIIGQIASIFGIIFVVFAAFAAIVNYEGITAQYGSSIGIEVLQYTLLTAMLPYLLYAALSFTVAGVVMRSTKPQAAPEETKPRETSEVPSQSERDDPLP
jgi:hypothetical protein